MPLHPFEIVWSPRSLRSLDKLSGKVAFACVEFAYGSLADNPHRVGRKLRFEFEGLHSARRGDFRIVYRIDDTLCEATIVAIEHRSDIYRS